MVGCNSIEFNSIECNSVERSNIYPNLNVTPLNEILLSNQQHFRLNKINEIKERELMSKKLSKYIAIFYYFENSLIVLSAQAVVFLSHHLQQLLEHL